MVFKRDNIWLQTVASTVVAVSLAVFGFALNHAAQSEGIFLLVPFCTGLAIAFISRGRKVVKITAFTSLLLSLGILILTGYEGFGCVLMAFPVLLLSIGFGSFVGYLLGKNYVHEYGNITVIVFCLVAMSLVGWTKGEPSPPKPLTVTTSMKFYAPMGEVWKAVRESSNIEGKDSVIRFLDLPVPCSCSLLDDGTRICYFEEGEMIQQVTHEEFGKVFQVDIVECTFEVRDWLTFEKAGYDFVQKDGYVQVTRKDTITSTLRPRWYWHWFEERCVQAEHRFVMSSMKREAEQSSIESGR